MEGNQQTRTLVSWVNKEGRACINATPEVSARHFSLSIASREPTCAELVGVNRAPQQALEGEFTRI